MAGRGRLALALGATSLVFGFAIFEMWIEGEAFEAGDFALEILDRAFIVGAMIAVAWTAVGLRSVRAEQEVMRDDLARAIELGESWRAGAEREIATLSNAIRHEFAAWALTPAEADVAGLLVKGVSTRDIARLRGTSETTIRQQAQAIYRKSGLRGRAELAAYFLDSLLEARAPQAELKAG